MRTCQRFISQFVICLASSILLTGLVLAADERLPADIKCVVCGKPADAKFFAEYKGGHVYLACPNCVAAFKADPNSFAEKAMAQLDAKGHSYLHAASLGATRNVHAVGKNLLCGQPSAEDIASAKKRGIEVVVTLRTKGEIDWDEAGEVKGLGLEFHDFGFRAPDSLTDRILDGSLKVLAETKTKPVMMHCASTNRVGAVWLAHRVLNDGLSVDAAKKEAATVGLRTPAYEARVLDYIRRRQAAEKSIRPGINKRFLDPKLDVSEWLGRFEVESREVFAQRSAVVKACGIRPGQTVADIGAGTGFFSRLFTESVGPAGEVFAVDISPKFLEHITRKAREEKVTNITTVACTDRSVKLGAESIDVAFVCDTYHHFEYPRSTLDSILRALKPGGVLIVIDFERIAGKSREFVLNHVRAGKDVFRGEIEAAGFEFVEEVDISGFNENYFLRYQKSQSR